jgi:hypothetical protein
VRRRLGSRARPLAAILALTLALAGAAPAAASEATPSPAAGPRTLAAAASAAVAAKPLPTGALAQAAPSGPSGSSSDLGSKSFFKTPAGKISLVLMAAGTGYMVYSAFKDNDPVKSQFR